jgi:hypothetical protein
MQLYLNCAIKKVEMCSQNEINVQLMKYVYHHRLLTKDSYRVAIEPENQGSQGKVREKHLVKDVREKSGILK